MRKDTISSLLIFLILAVNGIFNTLAFNFDWSQNFKTFFLAIAIIWFIYTLFLGKVVDQIKLLLAFSFLGNEIFFFSLPFLFLPKFLGTIFSKYKVKRVAILYVIFLSYSLLILIGSSLNEFSFFTPVLWFITFGGHLLIFLHYSTFVFSEDESVQIVDFFFKLILFQIPILLIQGWMHMDFTPGDSWTGSSGNSIIIGFYFCFFLITQYLPLFVRLNYGQSFIRFFTLKRLLLACTVIILLYYNDSKMIILSSIGSIVLFLFFVAFIKLLIRPNSFYLMKLLGILVLAVVGANLLFFSANLYLDRLYPGTNGLKDITDIYLARDLSDDGVNAKAVLYRRVYREMFFDSSVEWIFGVGPGKLGSKTSNILAYDILYKGEEQARLPNYIPPFSGKWVKKYMGDLWTRKIAETSQFRSATLSFPFAGLVTIKAEYGLIGLLLFLYMMYYTSYLLLIKSKSVHKSIRPISISLSLFWFSLPVHMIFDNFQEKTYIIVPMLLLTAVVVSIPLQQTKSDVTEKS